MIDKNKVLKIENIINELKKDSTIYENAPDSTKQKYATLINEYKDYKSNIKAVQTEDNTIKQERAIRALGKFIKGGDEVVAKWVDAAKTGKKLPADATKQQKDLFNAIKPIATFDPSSDNEFDTYLMDKLGPTGNGVDKSAYFEQIVKGIGLESEYEDQEGGEANWLQALFPNTSKGIRDMDREDRGETEYDRKVKGDSNALESGLSVLEDVSSLPTRLINSTGYLLTGQGDFTTNMATPSEYATAGESMANLVGETVVGEGVAAGVGAGLRAVTNPSVIRQVTQANKLAKLRNADRAIEAGEAVNKGTRVKRIVKGAIDKKDALSRRVNKVLNYGVDTPSDVVYGIGDKTLTKNWGPNMVKAGREGLATSWLPVANRLNSNDEDKYEQAAIEGGMGMLFPLAFKAGKTGLARRKTTESTGETLARGNTTARLKRSQAAAPLTTAEDGIEQIAAYNKHLDDINETILAKRKLANSNINKAKAEKALTDEKLGKYRSYNTDFADPTSTDYVLNHVELNGLELRKDVPAIYKAEELYDKYVNRLYKSLKNPGDKSSSEILEDMNSNITYAINSIGTGESSDANKIALNQVKTLIKNTQKAVERNTDDVINASEEQLALFKDPLHISVGDATGDATYKAGEDKVLQADKKYFEAMRDNLKLGKEATSEFNTLNVTRGELPKIRKGQVIDNETMEPVFGITNEDEINKYLNTFGRKRQNPIVESPYLRRQIDTKHNIENYIKEQTGKDLTGQEYDYLTDATYRNVRNRNNVSPNKPKTVKSDNDITTDMYQVGKKSAKSIIPVSEYAGTHTIQAAGMNIANDSDINELDPGESQLFGSVDKLPALKPSAYKQKYKPVVDSVATANKLDPVLFNSLIAQESGYNPNAESEVGAYGMGQLMPATAKQFGVTDRSDPVQNLNASAKYFNSLLKRYDNDVDLALAAYNWGLGKVDVLKKNNPGATWDEMKNKQIIWKGKKQNVPEQTLQYGKKIKARMKKIKEEEK